MFLDCTLHPLNVLDADQREKFMRMLEEDVTGPGKDDRDRFVVIAGGDGSLSTTVSMLRQRPIILDAMKKKLLAFAILPMGTACDAAQIFGWGNVPQDEEWLSRIESLIEDVVTGQGDLLSVWRVDIQTEKTQALTAASKTDQTIFKN